MLEFTTKEELQQLGYIIVYQGGHHDVWCNKVEHIHTTGGFCHPEIVELEIHHAPTICICLEWENYHKDKGEFPLRYKADIGEGE